MRRIAQTLALFAQSINDLSRVFFEQIEQEQIGMNRFNSITCERRIRKVAEIESHDIFCVCCDGRRQNVAIIGVGQRQIFDQRFVVLNARIG